MPGSRITPLSIQSEMVLAAGVGRGYRTQVRNRPTRRTDGRPSSRSRMRPRGWVSRVPRRARWRSAASFPACSGSAGCHAFRSGTWTPGLTGRPRSGLSMAPPSVSAARIPSTSAWHAQRGRSTATSRKMVTPHTPVGPLASTRARPAIFRPTSTSKVYVLNLVAPRLRVTDAMTAPAVITTSAAATTTNTGTLPKKPAMVPLSPRPFLGVRTKRPRSSRRALSGPVWMGWRFAMGSASSNSRCTFGRTKVKRSHQRPPFRLRPACSSPSRS